MKMVLIATGLWALIVGLAFATCGDGCTEREGVCACEAPVEVAPDQADVASDEKPSKHPESAWERGEVIADTPPSVAAQDASEDKAKAEATEEGKASAGLE